MNIQVPKASYKPQAGTKSFASHRESWFDVEHRAACALDAVLSHEYYGDALPCYFPNLGPDIFSAYFGTELDFGENTSWSHASLEDWSEVAKIEFSESNVYWQKTVALTKALLEAGRGNFYTGLTDLHPGGDAVAAFRDPMNLGIDMIENKEEVKNLLFKLEADYFKIYDTFYETLRAARQPLTSWIGMYGPGKFYIPSNDFSCMISKESFDEIFLPGIVRECRFLDQSIYHLDGPGALQHLDSLLSIEELDAIQWVYGAGAGPLSRWFEVYKRCQDAGKGIQVYCNTKELDTVIENLSPKGVWLGVHGVKNGEEAKAILQRIERWR
ncbi:MAG: hypothetical protein HQL31_04380 [Planctomycetes bacterium]|nr:hypothetical protein [Planctomycetota bacterium]